MKPLGLSVNKLALSSTCLRLASVKSSTSAAGLPLRPPCDSHDISTPTLSSGSICRTSTTWKYQGAPARSLKLSAGAAFARAGFLIVSGV